MLGVILGLIAALLFALPLLPFHRFQPLAGAIKWRMLTNVYKTEYG